MISVIEITTVICSTLSLISCVLSISYIFLTQKIWSLSYKLFFELMLSIFIMTTCHLFSTFVANDYISCQLQGVFLQYSLLNSVLLTSCLCHHMYSLTPIQNRNNFIVYNMISYILPCIPVIILLINHKIESTDLWCWIKDDMYEMLCFYIPLLVCIIYDIFICIYTKVNIAKRHIPIEIGNIHFQMLFWYIIVYLIIWSAALCHRMFLFFYDESLPFLLSHTICTSLLGFFTSIIFLGYKNIASLFLTTKPASPIPPVTSSFSVPLITREDSVASIHSIISSHVSLLVYTYNMAEHTLPPLFYTNIPKDIDMYFITLQECMDINKAMSSFDKHINSTCSYTLYSSYIGSSFKLLGYHGYILTLVYIRSSLLPEYDNTSSLHFRTGTDLVVSNASNKGVAGISVRLASGHTILFLGCHLTSDEHNKSRVYRRVSQINSLFRDIHIESEGEGQWNIQNIHSLTFVAGDLNFRCTDSFHHDEFNTALTDQQLHEYESLMNVKDTALSYSQKCLLIHLFNTIIESCEYYKQHIVYNINLDLSPINQSDADLLPDFHNQKSNNKSHNNNGYPYYIQHFDELYNLKSQRKIFDSFQEGDIHFPPTFRYQKDSQGDCSDYTNIKKLLSAFTYYKANSGLRTPSYTDRILYSTLPGYKDCIEQEYYSSNNSFVISDHKPVFALYKVSLPVLSLARSYTLIIKNIKCKSSFDIDFSTITFKCPIPAQDLFWKNQYMDVLRAGIFVDPNNTDTRSDYMYNLVNNTCSQITIFLNNIVSKDIHVALSLMSNQLSLQSVFVIPNIDNEFVFLNVPLYNGTEYDGTITFDISLTPL